MRTIQVMLRMGYTLAQDRTELDRLAAASAVGAAAAAALFPPTPRSRSPFSPRRASHGAHRSSFRRPARPTRPPGRRSASRRPGSARRELGSNNWAVAPDRTRDGAALLAGDPHLDLTLPSIWYEAHLAVPGVVDEYGVTIPGLPAIAHRVHARRRLDASPTSRPT